MIISLKKRIIFLATIIIFCNQLKSQSLLALKNELADLISTKNATIGISLKEIENKDTLHINGNLQMPMMSVFKFHIALAILHQVDEGKIQLEQKFFVKKEQLHPNTWSPIREDFPDGNKYFTLDQLLRYTVSHSDNNGCDILIKIAGGTKSIQKFINKQGIKDCKIEVNEQQMMTWNNLYKNTTTPLATTALLEKFYNGEILKKETTLYLYQIMVETSRGLNWMKGGLPSDTELAHRTGISDTDENNLRVAMNDVGIFKLPNGKHIILSVYLYNIKETRQDTEKIISDIAQATWNHYAKQMTKN